MVSCAREQQAWAEAKARKSQEAAQRDEVFRAMQRAEAERIEAKTMRLGALRAAKESPKPDAEAQKLQALFLAGVEPAVHVPAGLERRDHLLRDRDLGAIARVSSGAGVTPLDPEHAKAAQLNPISLRQRRRDRVQDGVDDLLHVALVQVRVLGAILSISSDLIMRAPGCAVLFSDGSASPIA